MIGAPTTGRAVVSAAIRDMQVPGWGSGSPQAARSPQAAAHKLTRRRSPLFLHGEKRAATAFPWARTLRSLESVHALRRRL